MKKENALVIYDISLEIVRIIKNNQMAEITKRQLAIIRTCPQTLNEMCVALLEEAGRRINPELVRRAAVYIAVSRHGLRPEDLGALLGENWDILDFAHLVAYMSDSFLRRDDGRYDFTHQSIRAGFRAVCDNEKQIQTEILEYLKTLPAEDDVSRTEIVYHTIKADDKAYFVHYITIAEQLVEKYRTVDAYDDLAVSYYNLAMHPAASLTDKKAYLQKALELAHILYDATRSDRYQTFIGVFTKALNNL